jgi:hypothetical protein
MFRNFVSNGHTYRVSIVTNNIAFNLFGTNVSDAVRDACLVNLARSLGTDTRTAYRVARAMHLRSFLHYPLPLMLNGAAYRRAVDAIGYINA